MYFVDLSIICINCFVNLFSIVFALARDTYFMLAAHSSRAGWQARILGVRPIRVEHMALMLNTSEMLYYLDFARQDVTSPFNATTLTQLLPLGDQ